MKQKVNNKDRKKSKNPTDAFPYPGTLAAVDGNTAVSMSERNASDAAGAYPITPSTQMGEYWAEATAAGYVNVSGRPLIFIEPEGEHAAAAVTAGLSMSGLRSANFSSGQGIAYMHESLYAAVGKRLTYVLNIGARAMTKSSLNVHAGHDDYHCIDDTGFFQMFAKNAQHAADLNLIAHRIAELVLTPGIVAQDGFLTTHLIETVCLPERELVETFLGRPEDIIDTPTAAQRMIYGDTRRRIPLLWDVDNPLMAGIVENQDAYMQSVAAQRPYFFDHIEAFTEQVFEEFYQLSGRRYQRIMGYRLEDADYVIAGQGSVIPSAEAVADYYRDKHNIKVGVLNVLMFRPFAEDLISQAIKGKKGVTVLERVDQPLAVEQPLLREIRATVSKCLENSWQVSADGQDKPHPQLESFDKQHVPMLYSGSFGLGSRDLQPEGLVAAVENMLPQGAGKKQFYLGIDFIQSGQLNPKQQLHKQTLMDSYPHVADLALHGSENPNLMPADSVTVRMHSIGGWGAITTGKNLALTLFELLGYHIKANPKYGSEKKGQPTTFYLSAAPQPIRINCEYYHVDVVLSPDPNVFNHSNALAGLKKGGIFIIQSEHTQASSIWQSIPNRYQKIIQQNEIHVFTVDAFRIAREEASDADLQLRMQGIAFQGAFFAATGIAEKAGMDESKLLQTIEQQLQHKFGTKGARVVQDNVRVVKRGFDETNKLDYQNLSAESSDKDKKSPEVGIPHMVRLQPQSQTPVSSIHRFWEQTGSLYGKGAGSDNIADPFVALGTMPAATGWFRDMSGIRFHHPRWIAQNCTACGDCYTVCPDTAIPGLVNDISATFDAVVSEVKKTHQVESLSKTVRRMEIHLRTMLNAAQPGDDVQAMLIDAAHETIVEAKNEIKAEAKNEADANKNIEQIKQELDWFMQSLDGFEFALTRPFYTLVEKNQPGRGALFNISINPYTCKGCMECVEVCKDGALEEIPQTAQSEQQLKDLWALWLQMPNSPKDLMRIPDLEQGIGLLENILLDKNVYMGLISGDGACLGCSEKTVMHLFIATVEALMLPRVAEHLTSIEQLMERLKHHIQLKLVAEIDVADTAALDAGIERLHKQDVTLASIAEHMEQQGGGEVIDRDWLHRVSTLMRNLKQLHWQYQQGITGKGRSHMGIINATGCSSVWGSTYPYNPYPFPWANHLFQDSPSMAMGVFEGHMVKMAQGFKTIRLAEMELAGKLETDAAQLNSFSWHMFDEHEWSLCPPVVAVGGDGAMYDIGFQNLSRLLMSGKPIKVVVLDTQVYSNTGGQACTSGFLGQVSDMAPFGSAAAGKQEIRKELGLIAMAHRSAYISQSTIARPAHMIEGFIQGLMSKRPALFDCYASCQPEHGIGDNMSYHQATLAVQSRAYPLFHFDPDLGDRWDECLSLRGNPDLDKDWADYPQQFREHGSDQTVELPFTFADFALTETRLRKHFRQVPEDDWQDNMLPLYEYLALSPQQRKNKDPFVWNIDKQQHRTRMMVDDTMAASCEDRLKFWRLLKSLKPTPSSQSDQQTVESQIRREVIGKIVAGLSQLAGDTASNSTVDNLVEGLAGNGSTPAESDPNIATQSTGGAYMAPWIDSEDCSACDECTDLNSQIFAYNDKKQAYIKNPNGGPYEDLVTAAERCTEQVIHPGLPAQHTEPLQAWIERAKAYNL